MNEIKRISDRVAVLRDGEYINTVVTAETEIDEIIKMMVGRDVSHNIRKTKSSVPVDAPVILEAEHITSPKIDDVTFNLRQGEILGFAGLVGSGRTEVMRLIFGADPMESGEIRIRGQKINVATPQDAVSAGVAYLSEDRKRYGLVLGLTVTGNATIASLDKFLSHRLFIDKKSGRMETQKYIDNLRIKTPSSEQLVKNLSGGNQQKVVIAKWLIRDTDILIFDEPTRGIDIGAKAKIYNLMEDLVKAGKSIIMISSELPEILRMSDRVVVMCNGRKTAELDIAEADSEIIMKYATQFSD